MNRTLFTAVTLSVTLLTAGALKAAQAGEIPTVPTTTLATLLVGQQNADDEFNAGVDFQRRKQWDKAIVSFSNAIKKSNPSDADTYYYSRAECYLQLGQFDKAIADYTQVINLKPRLADAYRFRGRAYNQLQQPDKAIADFDKALQLKGPGFFEIYGDRAESYLKKKDYDKAIADYSIFIERIKRTRQVIPEVYDNRGQAYLAKYQTEKQDNKANLDDVKLALADFEEYISEAASKNPPSDPTDAYLSRGDAYLITDDYDKAISNFGLYLNKNTTDAYAYGRRGVAYEKSKNMDAALADFQKALAINPTDANAQAGYTRILLTKDPKTALAELSKGISSPPKKEQKDRVASRALVYMQLGDTDKVSGPGDYANAINDYNFLLKLDPNDKGALSNRATANLKLGAYDKAVTDYDSYLALEKTDQTGIANALTGKAAALISLKQYDKAADTFTGIIALNEAAKKDDPEAYFNRAKAYYNYGTANNNDKVALQKASADLDVYTKAKPDNKDAAKLKTDVALLMAGSPDEQIKALTLAIQNDPTNAGYRLNLGAVYFKQEKYDEAITAYNEAIKVKSDDPVAFYSRAAAYAKKKDWDSTAKDASSALALKPDYSDALLLRAQASLEGKKYPDAIRDYEAIYAKDKTNGDALKGLAYAYIGSKDYTNTIRVLNDYIPKNPNDLEAIYSRGVANVGLMKYPEGIADLTKYITGGGKEQATALYNRGLANDKMGNNDAAVADYEASLSLKNDYNVAVEAGKAYAVQGDKFRDPDPPKAAALYAKASDVYAKAATALDDPANKDLPDLQKKKAEAIRSEAVAKQNQGFLLEKIDILKDSLPLFDQYLQIAKPLNLPEVADVQALIVKINKYIKDNS
jgi:tetratricopeptide (TPR) repeat protein